MATQNAQACHRTDTSGIIIVKLERKARENHTVERGRYAWSPPWAKDAQKAEAYASRLAIRIAAKEREKGGANAKIIIQGDDINIIGYWQGARRAKTEKMFDIFQAQICGLDPEEVLVVDRFALHLQEIQ